MKKIYILFTAVLALSTAHAQNPIPNANFSTYWPSNPGQPNGWTDSRDIAQVSPGNGNGGVGWAAQGYKSANTYPAFITSSGGNGINISTPYSFFHLYYKFTSVSGDFLIINVTVRNSSGTQIGSGVFQQTNNVGTFTPLTIPINYSGTGAVNDVIISVLMNPTSGANPHVGSNFIIDDLSLTTTPSALGEIEKESPALALEPNPATNFVQIHVSDLPSKTAELKITNALGQTVIEKMLNSNIETIDISGLPAGYYFVAVKNDGAVRTRRLVIN